MKIKNHINIISIIILFQITSYGKSKEIPDSLINIFHNNIYIQYSHGITVYFGDVSKGIVESSENRIKSGTIIEPEFGFFIKDFMRIGASYTYLNGKSEDSISDGAFEYNDIYFSGGSIKCKYYVINKEKLKIPIGVEGFVGRCKFFKGTTDDPDAKRGMNNYDGDPLYYKALGFGGGILGAVKFHPTWFMSLGIESGIRLITSQGLGDRSFNYELLDENGDQQKIGFSGYFLKLYLSFQL